MMHKLIRNVLATFGYDIRYSPGTARAAVGRYWAVDVQRAIQLPSPILFDVGANVGQTLCSMKKAWPQATVHCFEPSPDTFALLEANARLHSGAIINRSAVGATCGQVELIENEQSILSSILPLDRDLYCRTTIQKTMVPLTTVDEYCRQHRIDHIDVLKSDTQGYDLEVFRGCTRMFAENRISFVLSEVNFTEVYCGQARYDELLRCLADQSFGLVSFYNFTYDDERLEWCDALFVNRAALESRGASRNSEETTANHRTLVSCG